MQTFIMHTVSTYVDAYPIVLA